MQDEHRNAIQSNFISLVEQTDLDWMVSALYEKGVFSERMIEPYRDSTVEVRKRKQQLYMDIVRRGPEAFGHLIDALTEAGHWNLVRDLDPHSSLHLRQNNPTVSRESDFLSLCEQKKKKKTEDQQKSVSPPQPPVVVPPAPATEPPIEYFEVTKSTHFFEGGKDIKLYRTRGRNRGVLVVLSYVSFLNDIESYRPGVHVDCFKLKHLFGEIGFKVLLYRNLTEPETLNTLDHLKEVLVDTECVFIVVSSHGYARSNSSDTDIRLSDGHLLSLSKLLEHFNNKNFPTLRNIPKVFIFQLCRGPNEDYTWVTPKSMPVPGAGAGRAGRGAHTFRDGAAATGTQYDGQPRQLPDNDLLKDRLYSDILIAHSTIPGYVSHRDSEKGSWYIQALCEVFAARAHDCHVVKLLSLVDEKLRDMFSTQTSSVDNWGFNKRLYLHPGLFEN